MLEMLLTIGSDLQSKCYLQMLKALLTESSAISPTPPFSRLAFLRIEAILVPLFLTSLLVPQELVYKTTGFAIGFGLFGDPIISRGLEFLDVKFPNWLEMLEPKK